MKQENKTTLLQRRWSVFVVIGILLAIVASLFIPWNIGSLLSHSQPAQSYAEAVQRIEAIGTDRASEMNPVCRAQFMTHGQRAERAILLLHGYTSCPQQFLELGQRFYDLGYNVLIAPLPHHGLADRLTDEQSQLTANELASYADEMVDIGQGLGEQVVVMGISGGGVTTAWAAQNRSDLDLAVIISPAFGFKEIPTPLTAPAMNLTSVLPEKYVWWDPILLDKIGPPHAYPRYSRHALAQILRLGFSVQVNARQMSPAAKAMLVVTNANDTSVNNVLTYEVTANWRQHSSQVETYEFAAELGLAHDLIDPAQPEQRIDIVYPKLIDLITN